MAVTSYGRNKNHDDEIKKNQEKANNSPSYRCAATKNENSTEKKKKPACHTYYRIQTPLKALKQKNAKKSINFV